MVSLPQHLSRHSGTGLPSQDLHIAHSWSRTVAQTSLQVPGNPGEKPTVAGQTNRDICAKGDCCSVRTLHDSEQEDPNRN